MDLRSDIHVVKTLYGQRCSAVKFQTIVRVLLVRSNDAYDGSVNAVIVDRACVRLLLLSFGMSLYMSLLRFNGTASSFNRKLFLFS